MATKKEVPQKNNEVQKILVENSIALQKVLTNLSINLDNLSKQISRLLQLFEQSAKTIAEKDFDAEISNRRIMEKIDNLAVQNKTIAQGMALMHDKLANSPAESRPEEQGMEGYQKSVSPQKFNPLPRA